MLILKSWMPLLWLLIAVAMAILEAATVQLVAIWFVFGALAAMFAAALGLPIGVQAAVCLLTAALTLAATRPLLRRRLAARQTPTNADRVIGQVGVICEGTGTSARVLVDSMQWAARSADGQPLSAGDEVLVRAIEGATLLVEKLI